MRSKADSHWLETPWEGGAEVNPDEEIRCDLVILIPVYNEWESFELLLTRIGALEALGSLKVAVLAVNDGGLSAVPSDATGPGVDRVFVLHLIRNLGHQRAIAVGLSFIARTVKCDAVVVMDGDGEDRPGDVEKLLAEHKSHPGSIVFAGRVKRSEGFLFRFFYKFYKLLFRILTGSEVSFGNFCIIPQNLISKVIYVPEIINHLAAAVIKAKFPIRSIPSERGERIAGESRMDFVSLVIHGLSAIAAHLEKVCVRIIVASMSLGLLALVGIVVVVGIRYLTDLAILGWATNVALGLGIIALQGTATGVILAFLVLAHRMQTPSIPALMYRDCVESFQEISCEK